MKYRIKGWKSEKGFFDNVEGDIIELEEVEDYPDFSNCCNARVWISRLGNKICKKCKRRDR